jgi:murein DD-endopeptidase MepM/ murein hydrolase activator NlpD
MKRMGLALVTVSLLAITACGSHNRAPVVYGTDPARQTRVYHSPDDIYRERRTAQEQTAQAPAYRQPEFRASPSTDIEPVKLAPLSAVYLDDNDRARAQQASATAPAQQPHLHKAKGYIEVERGDTVYAIARRFNVSPADVIDENDLKKPYALKVGQVLKLPNGAAAMKVDAPVQSSPSRVVVAKDELYTVRSGDTLYSISRRSGVPVANIASANNLPAPYALEVGRRLVIPQAPTGAKPVLTAQKAPAESAASSEPPPSDVAEIARQASYSKPAPVSASSMFDWPVRGAVISEFGSGDLGRRNDGVNIAAPVGTAVRAAADGQVVYRGSELEGFGNLLLVKHSDGYVTAYAHNDAMLVKKGDQVRKGQVIAKVGQTGAVTTPQLHFEIRQQSKAVDPVALLGKQ